MVYFKFMYKYLVNKLVDLNKAIILSLFIFQQFKKSKQRYSNFYGKLVNNCLKVL